MMEIRGNTLAMAGGREAIGSRRYSFRSSSVNGTDAQKYENVLLSGIISLRKRSANCPTLSLARFPWADILKDSLSLPESPGRTAFATLIA